VALDLVADRHEIGRPRSVTSCPRTRPSVGCIEMVRHEVVAEVLGDLHEGQS
jgi:hypothetical protein